MRYRKRYLLALLGFIALLGGVVSACGTPGYVTYTNEAGGYSFSYPINWQTEVSADSMIYIVKSKSGLASVRIDVIGPMSAQDAAQRWGIAMGTGNAEFALKENKAVEGPWDWYMSYDYDAGTGPFHGEAYFKSTTEHVYKLDTAADLAGYGNYPFPYIISSFKLE